MNRHVGFLFGVLSTVALVFNGCAGCDNNEEPMVVGHGGGGASTASTVSTAGSGGSGGGVVYWVPGNPGTPGTPIKLGGGIPFAQGLTKPTPIIGASYTMANNCGSGGSAGAGTGGSGGSAGENAGGSAGSGGDVFEQCPSAYDPASPVMDLSLIGETDVEVYVASPPIFQPVGDNWGDCPTELEVISHGALYKGDCTGVTTEIDIFTSADLTTFFGADMNILPTNTEIVMDGAVDGAVRLVSGIAISTAASGDRVFAASNVWNEIVTAEPDLQNPGEWTRIDTDVGSKGISALLALPNGKILFATNRTFTVESFSTAGYVVDYPDPSAVLVQDQPILLKTFDPNTGVIASFASISGSSRVIPQYCGPATVDPGTEQPLTCFFAGSANILAMAQNGNILFSDRLDGIVYEIAVDGSTTTPLFTVPDTVAVTGLAQPPNDIIYVVASPTADFNATQVTSPPRILYWDNVANSLVEWTQLDDVAYTNILSALTITGVLERWYGANVNFLGAGLFINIASDTQGNLMVTQTVKGSTIAYPVVP